MTAFCKHEIRPRGPAGMAEATGKKQPRCDFSGEAGSKHGAPLHPLPGQQRACSGGRAGRGVGGRCPSPPHAEAAVHFFPGQNYSSLGPISVLVTQLKVSVAEGLVNPLLSLRSPRTLLSMGL